MGGERGRGNGSLHPFHGRAVRSAVLVEVEKEEPAPSEGVQNAGWNWKTESSSGRYRGSSGNSR